ncbi:MAG: LCP family protein [Clostridia bacterium]|nr:LCP family protein [Clostridia bacterium]
MKRARPKNKKAAAKKQRMQEIHEENQTPQYGETSETETRKVSDGNAARGRAKKTKGSRSIPKIITGVLAVAVIFLFVIMGFGLFDESQILAPLENGKINVLLLGVDEDGLRTDAIMVASYDVNEADVNMLSIPRDTKVYVSNRKVTRKINEVHAMSSKKDKSEIVGAEATAEVVTQLTGIPINYYVEFSFSAIDRLFDILGPVEFDVPDVEGDGQGMNYDDPYQNLHIHLKPGLQKLSGNQVQQFLRYRKSNSNKGSGSDTDRVMRQQEFVKAVVEQKVNIGILTKLPSIFKQISKEINTNISGGDVTKYIRYLNKLTGEGIHTHSLPGENKTISGGSYFVCNLDETKTLMSEVFGYDAEITDKVTISDTHSQKVLKAGNTTKATQSPEAAEDKSEKETAKPTVKPTVTQAASPTPTPTKAPVVTKSPTKAPVVTKSPTKSPEATKTPLEDWDEDSGVIEIE